MPAFVNGSRPTPRKGSVRSWRFLRRTCRCPQRTLVLLLFGQGVLLWLILFPRHLCAPSDSGADSSLIPPSRPENIRVHKKSPAGVLLGRLGFSQAAILPALSSFIPTGPKLSSSTWRRRKHILAGGDPKAVEQQQRESGGASLGRRHTFISDSLSQRPPWRQGGNPGRGLTPGKHPGPSKPSTTGTREGEVRAGGERAGHRASAVSDDAMAEWMQQHSWPPHSAISEHLQRLNTRAPHNVDKFPLLADDRVVVVLYVHHRPHFLRKALQGLERVERINETLLIVSHDGMYPEMNSLVQNISFCQVKQIFFPFSPHLFPNSFPGPSPSDCKGNSTPHALPRTCQGRADQYGNFREPGRTALKCRCVFLLSCPLQHHWWWMMNTVWDGLEETQGHKGHMVFVEEDILLLPQAYQHIQALVHAKDRLCPLCIGASLAPSRANFFGDSSHTFVRDSLGSIGYAFNRTVWEKLHSQSLAFCEFDDYNWDITLTHAVLAHWDSRDSLRWSRASAIHFGSCGMHINMALGSRDGTAARVDCDHADLSWLDMFASNPRYNQGIDDTVVEKVAVWNHSAPDPNFMGWGGWGDFRDQALCSFFSSIPRKVSR